MLFTADLRSFADRLAATKKVNVSVKEEDSEIKIKTEVTAAVALTAPKEEPVDIKVEGSETKPVAKAARGKKRKDSTEGIVHASQTTETRRVSKRLRR